jgi:hypothetical protein
MIVSKDEAAKSAAALSKLQHQVKQEMLIVKEELAGAERGARQALAAARAELEEQQRQVRKEGCGLPLLWAQVQGSHTAPTHPPLILPRACPFFKL